MSGLPPLPREAGPREAPLPPDVLALVQLVVDEFGGSVLGTPSEVERDGRAVGELCSLDWRELGWPATGHGLVELLALHADELAAAGLVVCHTPEGPGQPEFLAITDTAADLAARDAHPLPDLGDPLVDKIEAVLRRLVVGGSWAGTVNDVRLAWKRLPAAERDELPGPSWPQSAEPLSRALYRSRDELARRGLVVERVGRGLAVSLAISAEAVAA